MFYKFMDFGPIVLNYDIYSKEFQKLSILINAQNSTVRNKPVHDVLSTDQKPVSVTLDAEVKTSPSPPY